MNKLRKVCYAFLAISFGLVLASCSNGLPAMHLGDGTNSLLSDMIRVDVPETQLDTPKEIFVSQGSYSDRITVRWGEVEGATSYRVERAIVIPDEEGRFSDPEEGDFAVLTDGKHIYGTTVTDYIFGQGNTPLYTAEQYRRHNKYYYRVIAQDATGAYDDSFPTDTKHYGFLFEPVQNVHATAGASANDDGVATIKVEWDPLRNGTTDTVQGYEVSMSTDGNEGAIYTKLVDLSGGATSYDYKISDPAKFGQDFFFVVSARNNSRAYNVQSSNAIGYALKQGAPSTPVVTSVTRGTSNDTIKITWNASGGSGNDTMYYSVYRSSSIDSSKQMVKKDVQGAKGAQEISFEDSATTGGRKIESGVYYNYYIKAWYKKGGSEDAIFNGALSELDGEKTEGFILSAPSSIVASKKDGNITISFRPAIGNATEQSAYTYCFYKSATAKGTYDSLSATPTYNAETGMYEAVFSNSEIGGAQFFKVSTKYTPNGGAEIESAQSDPVSPAPYAATDCVATRAANVGGSPNVNGVYPIKITWKKPSTDEPAGYYVYRSTDFTKGFKNITEEPVVGTSYTDENISAKAGTIYYYKVLSLNTLNQGANYSNTDYGYGALTPEQYLSEYIATMKSSQSRLTFLNKSADLDKMGDETINDLVGGGTLYYLGKLRGLSGADFTMKYTNYADYQITYTDPATGSPTTLKTFWITGNTDSTTDTSGKGHMIGTVTAANCMYPGKIYYDNVGLIGGKIKSGYYEVEPAGFSKVTVDFTYGTW